MSSGKASSEGTKVTLGKNAPVTQEAPGTVTADSLAAESLAFQSANEAVPTSTLPHQDSDLDSATKPNERTEQATTTKSDKTTGSAPTYVQSQYMREASGPHGKNIKEDESIGAEDKAKYASFSEFGTKNDPALLAEKNFVAANSTPANMTGARQTGIDGKTPYDALASEKEA